MSASPALLAGSGRLAESGRLARSGRLASAGPILGDALVESISADQARVVRAAHAHAIGTAQHAVDQFRSNLDGAQAVLDGDQAAAEHADSVEAAADARLSGDKAALDAAATALHAATAQVQADRDRMQVIAVGMYTGQLTNPQPAGIRTLAQDQEAMINAGEVSVVAEVVDRDLRSDLATAAADAQRQAADQRTVTSDRTTAVQAAATAAAHRARVAGDEATVAADRSKLGGAQDQLDRAKDALRSALATVLDGSAPGSLSVMGGAALDVPQMVSWYSWEGYADLTSTSIGQLAHWYLQVGAAEGVRGDVAFAQAVLETGGFSSPDSVEYNNYAGIGHCDSCSSGWDFPSAYDGVLGQVQLLRIFAGGGTPSNPVLPAFTTSQEHESGCCTSFESLTGVWATDPTYGSQILAIYQQMLDYALSA